jgi:hypothetical protein
MSSDFIPIYIYIYDKCDACLQISYIWIDGVLPITSTIYRYEIWRHAPHLSYIYIYIGMKSEDMHHTYHIYIYI